MHEWIDFVIDFFTTFNYKNETYDDDDVDGDRVHDDSRLIDVYIDGCYYYSYSIPVQNVG